MRRQCIDREPLYARRLLERVVLMTKHRLEARDVYIARLVVLTREPIKGTTSYQGGCFYCRGSQRYYSMNAFE